MSQALNRGAQSNRRDRVSVLIWTEDSVNTEPETTFPGTQQKERNRALFCHT